ncbi:MAG: hypothetical protein ACI8ZM_004330 [Crocinitomix sp.]|jgi:hypothetical protein
MKEEIAVRKHEAGDAQTNEIEMGQDYRNQLYFDLETNQVVKSNLKTEWDLTFESNGDHIVLNTGKGMSVHKSSLTFAEINLSEDLEWNWDAHSGNLDSTAFGNWEEENFIYVIDRGYNWTGDHQGYFKLAILSSDENTFDIGYAEISSDTQITYSIEKSTTEQFTYFSFESGTVSIAPPDLDYDLIFTQYTHLFTDPLTPYLVTGIITNRGFTSIARLDDKPFTEIELQDVESLEFSYDLDAIGYDWKYYSLEEGFFTTYSNQHYIIRTQNGFYYKLRIVGFYNSDGLKGYPNIEFQAL